MPEFPLDALIEQLQSLADEKYRTFNESLTPGTEGKSFGVRMPALRKVAKQILQSSPSAFLDSSLGNSIHEINLLHAIVLSKEPRGVDQTLARIRNFVPTISNWAVCDVFCNDLKPSESLKAALLPLLRTAALLKSNVLDRFTHNKAIQKCIESYRISDQEKQYLRSLRR